LNHLLVELDGFDQGATGRRHGRSNRLQDLDPGAAASPDARPAVLVGSPDLVGREEILKVQPRESRSATMSTCR